MIISTVEVEKLSASEKERFYKIGLFMQAWFSERGLKISEEDVLIGNKINGKRMDEGHEIDGKIVVPRAALSDNKRTAKEFMKVLMSKTDLKRGSLEYEDELIDMMGHILMLFFDIIRDDYCYDKIKDAVFKLDEYIDEEMINPTLAEEYALTMMSAA